MNAEIQKQVQVRLQSYAYFSRNRLIELKAQGYFPALIQLCQRGVPCILRCEYSHRGLVKASELHCGYIIAGKLDKIGPIFLSKHAWGE